MAVSDRFKSYAPDVQAVVHLEEALPPEHPVHVFIDLVRSVDLRHFVITPGPKGEKPYHPHALFGLLAWGYLHGVRSARKLARLARQEATFVYLAGGGRPNYRTLARFRRDNAAAFTAVFQETVILVLRVGLARLGHVALDGTKLQANTAKHKAMSYGRMRQREAQLKEEIARLLPQARRGAAASGLATLPTDRRDALQAAPAGRPSPLGPSQGHRRAGLRPAQRGPRLHHPQPARPRSRRR
jgi:transposase